MNWGGGSVLQRYICMYLELDHPIPLAVLKANYFFLCNVLMLEAKFKMGGGGWLNLPKKKPIAILSVYIVLCLSIVGEGGL